MASTPTAPAAPPRRIALPCIYCRRPAAAVTLPDFGAAAGLVSMIPGAGGAIALLVGEMTADRVVSLATFLEVACAKCQGLEPAE